MNVHEHAAAGPTPTAPHTVATEIRRAVDRVRLMESDLEQLKSTLQYLLDLLSDAEHDTSDRAPRHATHGGRHRSGTPTAPPEQRQSAESAPSFFTQEPPVPRPEPPAPRLQTPAPHPEPPSPRPEPQQWFPGVGSTGGGHATPHRTVATPPRIQLPDTSLLALHDESDLRPWQLEALAAWEANGRRGIVEAVTGSGKTRMALAAAGRVLADNGRVLICVPTLTLLRQWAGEFSARFPDVILGERCGSSKDGLRDHHALLATRQATAAYHPASEGVVPQLIIGDEVHGLGTHAYAVGLREDYRHRLGLTATLERADDGVTDILLPYFGDVVYQLGYGRALADGFIAPFKVALVEVPLSPADQTRYAAAHDWAMSCRTQLANLGVEAQDYSDFLAQVKYAATHPAEHPTRANVARRYLDAIADRRDILENSTTKIAALSRVSDAIRNASGTLVFTQLRQTAELSLGALEDCGLEARAVVSGQTDSERQNILEDLANGYVDAVAAPRVLDEGVDVPESDLGIVMAASRSRRQMVQRLGRVVRKSADNPNKVGRLIVMFAPNTSEDPGSTEEGTFMSVATEHAAATFRGHVDDPAAILNFLRS